MSQENFDRFVKCAVATLGVEASQVTREAKFADDLDAEEFGIEVPEEDLNDVTTVGQAFDLIMSKI
jgi:acyl carrier protein